MLAGHIDLAGLAEGDVVLCATHRLARHLHQAHDRARAAAGVSRWRPLVALSVDQWLAALEAEALLAGEINAAAAPRLVLSPVQERLLWERAIAADLGEGAEGALFDLEGLATTAQEANGLMEVWGIPAAEEAGEEARRFLRWRTEFRRRCREAGWLEPARATRWRIDRLAEGAGRLPTRLLFAGFDRYTPQEMRLAEAVARRGIPLLVVDTAALPPAASRVAAFADRAAECRAAAAWAARRLAGDSRLRLGIVVPDLASVTGVLADVLDASLQPAAFAPAAAGVPRRHNFSLGAPLARQPLVETALDLLRLAAHPRSVDQSDFGDLLRRPYWSADEAEADSRDRLEACLREKLGPRLSLDRLLRFVHSGGGRGIRVPRLAAHLEALAAQAAVQAARQWPSAWGAVFRRWLAAAGWPGERSLSSHEYQARQAFLEVLDSLAGLDAVLGKVSVGEAVSRLSRLCRDRVFQPETEGMPAVQVMGPLEAAGATFDGLWVLGMNDEAWPPVPRPNPLLPAEAQRRVGSPSSCAEVEAAFALSIHERLLRSAPEAIFSWARAQGDRELRPSPLIAGLAPAEDELPVPPVLAETLLGGAIDVRADHRAPPVAAGEELRGGAALIRAQAICPAWAFYRYRLGAKALETPAEGLEARDRGDLVHLVLETFWRDRGLDDLRRLMAAGLESAVAAAVDEAMAGFNAEREDPLPPRLAALEKARLVGLIAEWLAVESARGEAFRVAARERDEEVSIAGIAVRLRVDRVDELADGRRVIIDYKTGGSVSAGSWLDERIREPQLPLYAAWAPGGQVAGAALAWVKREKMSFVGMVADDGLLPKVKAQTDWPGLLVQWRQRIEAVALEIREGWAPVSFEHEKDLAYCEVGPLLRLPEARALRGSAGEEEDAA